MSQRCFTAPHYLALQYLAIRGVESYCRLSTKVGCHLSLNLWSKVYSSFQTTIEAAPAELSRYDTKIERLQLTVARLMPDRDALATYTDGCRSVYSPIRRLPSELLPEIFDMCAPAIQNYNDPNDPPEMDRLSKPHLLRLAQVCSLWHGISMGTPQLWSTIMINTSEWDTPPAFPDLCFSILQYTLRRSGSHPLTLVLAGSSYDDASEPVLRLLSQHAPRWRDVHFRYNFEQPNSLAAAMGNLDCLEKLHLPGHWAGPEIFQVSPRLTELVLEGRIAKIPLLPWAQLQKYRYIGDSHLSFSLLDKFPNIATCSFKLKLSSISPAATWPAVSLETRVLSFEFSANRTSVGQESVGCIFESLTLPRLASFSLGGGWVHPIWPTEHFVSLARRSSFHAHLTALTIDAIVTEEQLLRTLAVLPGLEELTIRDIEHRPALITDSLLQALTDTQRTPPCPVPGLSYLDLTSSLAFTDDALRDFVGSRIVRDSEMLFRVILRALPGRQRKLDRNVMDEVGEWILSGDVYFLNALV
ncbi:hypothetical protein DFH08DRAFT_1042055 [Mycena albidolilacea]|uniref:F-box domain-containing protein n=1 Tax=Mycena albidolilacea TaxID=1033008 RepID=A0AAD6ZAA2_9AGAR|nr:hypothetical protein DFH08DRAFT_1042055 [Mycena albidolilacea]